MKFRRPTRFSNNRGQSLVETALILPLLIMIVLNVVNLGYFLMIMVNLTGTARSSVEYAILGSASPTAALAPAPGPTSGTAGTLTVTYLAQQDMTGALWNPTAALVTVCTTNLGITSSGYSNCCTYTGSGSCTNSGSSSTKDPEAAFVLDEVDVQYQFNTLIPGTIFNIPLQASPLCNAGSCTFTRRAFMRAMN